MNLKLYSSLSEVKGIGKTYTRILKRNLFSTVFDLLLHFPNDYVDLSKPVDSLRTGDRQVLQVTVEKTGFTRFRGRKLTRLLVSAIHGAERLELVFFNQPYLRDRFTPQSGVLLFGRVEEGPQGLRMVNPVCFFDSHPDTVIPLYPKIATLTSGRLKRLIQQILDRLEEHEDELPQTLRQRYGFTDLIPAFHQIHRPSELDPRVIRRAISSFIYRECFFFQLELQWLRRHASRIPRRLNFTIPIEFPSTIEKSLPFTLTGDQKRAFAEIRGDLVSPYCMRRLLQGDVGSGKTVVLFMAIAAAVENGYQAVFLAPTELLARQQYEMFRHFFTAVSAGLISGSTPTQQRRKRIAAFRSGEIGLLFGTHTLLNETIESDRLALIVIDEQQRFGVSQRAALQSKNEAVDVLVATATPIPRTLLLALFEDIDLTRILEKPKGRLPVRTRIISPVRRPAFYSWLKQRMRARVFGVFVVVPLIEPTGQTGSIRSLQGDRKFYESISGRESIAFLSGQTPEKERIRVLRNFRAGRIRLLVATSVIEVGIDVPEAAVMVIENADRFGLAQLHQMRGRVGRGQQPGTCYLLASETVSEDGRERLEVMARCSDGFEIAELDLKMRGGGELGGYRQSGTLDFRVVDVKRDIRWMKRARTDAVSILDKPSEWNQILSQRIKNLEQKQKKISFS